MFQLSELGGGGIGRFIMGLSYVPCLHAESSYY
jgi:hypothetical protein